VTRKAAPSPEPELDDVVDPPPDPEPDPSPAPPAEFDWARLEETVDRRVQALTGGIAEAVKGLLPAPAPAPAPPKDKPDDDPPRRSALDRIRHAWIGR
jgi:hypothetical protein